MAKETKQPKTLSLRYKGTAPGICTPLKRNVEPGDTVDGVDADLAQAMAADNNGKWEIASDSPKPKEVTTDGQ